MICDFSVGPTAACQHRNGEFRCGKTVGNGFVCCGVMNMPPSAAESVGDFDYPCKFVRVIFFEARFRQTLKKTVVFPDCFDQVVCSGYAPSFHKVAFCLFGLSFAHPTHCCHKMKEHFRDGAARLLHPQGVFCHSYAAAVIAGEICLVSHGVGRE